jgi:LysR family hydrogen peroxide-inducible transcriptional activator
VPTIRARFPRLELLLVEEKTEVLLGQLREGKLDVAVLALPLHDEQLHVEFLFEEPFVLAVPKTHPLARNGALSLHDLANERLLLLEDGHCLRDQALDVCTRAGSGERTGFRATSLETLRQMVAANVGITLLPILSVKPPVAHSDAIKLLRFHDSHPSRRIGMVWRRSSAMAGFLRELADVMRALPKSLLKPDPAAPAKPSPVAKRVRKKPAAKS